MKVKEIKALIKKNASNESKKGNNLEEEIVSNRKDKMNFSQESGKYSKSP